ncbi:hypothetical protein RV14_GL000195 [Enterococcus ratti]|uniref:Uncharacterized protein n=2 Tax=Enterococcus ratti TaxID=150033 RepID=A0A1L8WKX7_9ENTE|nr:hypothetical protein RV14_GL000195 [Enterococcus ratti]
MVKIESEIHIKTDEILKRMIELNVQNQLTIPIEKEEDRVKQMLELKKAFEALTNEDRYERGQAFFGIKLAELDEQILNKANIQKKRKLENKKNFYSIYTPSSSIEKEKVRLENALKKYKKRERTIIGKIRNFIDKKKIQQLKKQLKNLLQDVFVKYSLQEYTQEKQKDLGSLTQYSVEKSKEENEQNGQKTREMDRQEHTKI